jgi:hypothetical protein
MFMAPGTVAGAGFASQAIRPRPSEFHSSAELAAAYLFSYMSTNWRLRMADADTSTQAELKVVITGPGIEIKQSISTTQLPNLLALLFNQPTPQAAAPGSTGRAHHGAGHAAPHTPGTKPSVMEYVNEKGAKTAPDIILAIARYAELYDNSPGVTKDEVRKYIRAARLPEPGNFHRDFGLALERAYLTDAGEGKFHVTQTGIKLIDQPGPISFPRGSAAPSRRRRPSKAAKEDKVGA